jgi:hypothetical protein
VRVAGGWPVFWPCLAALTLYYGLYEYLHWCMHKPTGRRIERTRIFRYLDANHRLHHARWRFNFNVVDDHQKARNLRPASRRRPLRGRPELR